ncbi:hypothetical protein B9Z55_017259 [Caenorhabditis nigoni]|nr:hypothetical protein B9Z55_017259 [Caenorhabditis nigoni]
MISNVTNLILLGIAISDIVNLSVFAEKTFFFIYQDACTLPKSLFITKLLNFLEFMKDDSRRLSTWFGVLMASLRYLILKNALNPNFEYLSKPSSGWKSLAIAFFISTLMSMFYLFRVEIVSKVWIIPAIVLPILAALLIRELKKAEVSRKKMSVSSQSSNNSDNTSKLVIIMTITCICAEGPMGIAFVIEGLVAASALRLLVIYFQSILFTFVILNATTHFFVCLGVSTPYRRAVKELLGYKKSQKPVNLFENVTFNKYYHTDTSGC